MPRILTVTIAIITILGPTLTACSSTETTTTATTADGHTTTGAALDDTGESDGTAESDSTGETEVLVLVTAHPDDELTISPLLAHYAKQGVDIYLVSVTSGQQGGDGTAVATGEDLGAVREAELNAAAVAYGIHDPIFIQNEDGEQDDLSAVATTELKAKLRAIFEEAGADVIVTFGPEGFTGHADHIAVGAITTELVEEWYAEADASLAPTKLYHTMFPASWSDQLPPGQNFVSVDDDEATTIVDASDGIAEAQAAVLAYETQFSAAEMELVQGLIGSLSQGQIYLRWVLAKDGESTFGETEIFAR